MTPGVGEVPGENRASARIAWSDSATSLWCRRQRYPDQSCLSAASGSTLPARMAGISAAHAHAATTLSRLAA